LSSAEVTEAIVGLASKCIIMTTFDSRAKEYFLLESTREYALRKLYESDEADDVLTRNAAYLARSYEQPYEGGFRPATLSSSLAAQSIAAR
jgi:predicted ATPase